VEGPKDLPPSNGPRRFLLALLRIGRVSLRELLGGFDLSPMEVDLSVDEVRVDPQQDLD
jgi:hypothetical protein